MRIGALAALGVVFSSAPLAARADPVQFVIAPQYTACGLHTSACSGSASTSGAIQYTFIRTARRALRIKLSRGYHLFATGAEGDLDAADQSAHAPATDGVYLRLQAFDVSGYLRAEVHAHYTYEYASPGESAYHSVAISYDPYFGRPVQRGSDGPARQLDVKFKASERFLQSTTAYTQWVFSLTPQITFPLNAQATFRIRTGYTAQQQLATAFTQTAYSGRFFAEFDRDFNPWTKGYAGYESSRLIKGESANVVFGVEWTL